MRNVRVRQLIARCGLLKPRIRQLFLVNKIAMYRNVVAKESSWVLKALTKMDKDTHTHARTQARTHSHSNNHRSFRLDKLKICYVIVILRKLSFTATEIWVLTMYREGHKGDQSGQIQIH